MVDANGRVAELWNDSCPSASCPSAAFRRDGLKDLVAMQVEGCVAILGALLVMQLSSSHVELDATMVAVDPLKHLRLFRRYRVEALGELVRGVRWVVLAG